jgi:hypothetical protein
MAVTFNYVEIVAGTEWSLTQIVPTSHVSRPTQNHILEPITITPNSNPSSNLAPTYNISPESSPYIGSDPIIVSEPINTVTPVVNIKSRNTIRRGVGMSGAFLK